MVEETATLSRVLCSHLLRSIL